MKMFVFGTKEEWLQYRYGKFTSSDIEKLMTDPTKKEQEMGEQLSKGAKTYVLHRIATQLALPEPDYYSAAMQHGNETEPQAAIAFAKIMGYELTDSDFIHNGISAWVIFSDDNEVYCGTPDIILPDAIAEIKCPAPHTHLKYMMLKTQSDIADQMPDYYAQMQLNMVLSQRDMCYFVSFDDRFYNEAHQIKIIEVNKDDRYILTMLHKINIANQFKNNLINNL
jgi:hypothetical protein